MAQLLKGKSAADEICRELEDRIQALGFTPCLAVIRLGSEGGSEAYERAVERRFQKLNLAVKRFTLPESYPEELLLGLIDQINARQDIQGILVLRPLPAHIDGKRVLGRIAREKDMDCVSPGALAALLCGDEDAAAPCTAESCIRLLEHYGAEIRGRRAAVIGRSLVVGKPLALMLSAMDATVTLCHSKTPDMAQICRQADIIIAAAGCPGLVTEEFMRPGQLIIDVGTSADSQGRLRGDVDFEAAERIAAGVSPVPGGVGSVTTAVLALHLVAAAERR